MKTDINGCSSTNVPSNEQYESFTMGRKRYVQYDYRAQGGELFSCVKPTLEQCREARDEWLSNR